MQCNVCLILVAQLMEVQSCTIKFLFISKLFVRVFFITIRRLFQNVNYFEKNFLFPMRLIKQFNCPLARHSCPDHEFCQPDNIMKQTFFYLPNKGESMACWDIVPR